MLVAPPRTHVSDLAAARRSLREQIARLEGEFALTLARTYPHLAVPGPIEHRGPRLLGELSALGGSGGACPKLLSI